MSISPLFKSILVGVFYITSTSLSACWNMMELADIEGTAELDDKFIISLKDAVSCQPVTDAAVTIGRVKLTSDHNGFISLPTKPFANIMDDRITMKVERSGYITLKTDLLIQVGTIMNRRQTMSRQLPLENIRFVLSWDQQPSDLDLHLQGDNFHISYRNMRSYPNMARLDRDAREGYGPETITLKRALPNQSYSVSVDNFSGESMSAGSGKLSIYAKNRLKREITLPSLSSGLHRLLTIRDGKLDLH